ncbi:hypothetical protein LZF95_07065 [Algoriphagus sp. AGSA1]|uniref:hypothetical protein n=1 Tax=Algoriphagus sp. AGSA1 TaxID=2907213 RepID=UPI001F3FFE87|nr:hypothetical protein [Algoriphagus sp. AGSA1]MCE7054426.1 hypothetical protein [Algoriphagus sp. AGSA1]
MKELSIEKMEMVIGGGLREDLIVGLACGSTILLAATPVAPLAILTGNVCAVGLIGYGLGKY